MSLFLLCIFAASLGSFFMCLADRILIKERNLFKPSFCFSCKKKLKFWHMIPIFSYIFLRASCAFCKAKISFYLFFSELISVFLALFAFYFTDNIFSFLSLCIFLCTLFCLSFLDFKLRAVPNFLLFFLVLLSFLYDVSSRGLFISFEDSFALRFFFFAGFIFFLKSLLSFFINFKNTDEIIESMGEADVLVLASMAGILGILQAFYLLFLSSLFALCFFIFLRLFLIKNYEMPMIPFFSVSFIILLGFFHETSI